MGVLASLICIVIDFRHVSRIVGAAIGPAANSVATRVTGRARHNEIIESQMIYSDTVRADRRFLIQQQHCGWQGRLASARTVPSAIELAFSAIG